MAFVHCVTLRVNCGYARTAIRELTPKIATAINTEKRESEFRDLYQQCPGFGLTDSYFKNKNSGRSRFNRDCTALTEYFGKKWHPPES